LWEFEVRSLVCGKDAIALWGVGSVIAFFEGVGVRSLLGSWGAIACLWQRCDRFWGVGVRSLFWGVGVRSLFVGV